MTTTIAERSHRIAGRVARTTRTDAHGRATDAPASELPTHREQTKAPA